MGGDREWNNQPPRHGHSPVPLWEKTFCTSICYVSWERICAAKVSMSGYRSITEWDDSGALEAFDNAKARYWADINGLPSEIPLPGPDVYNDKVDHNPFIDPELVADLERKPPPPPCQSNKHEDLSYEAFLSATLPVVATGWGDAEEEVSNTKCEVEKPLPTTGWDVAGHLPANGSSGHLWNNNGGWGDGPVSDAAWNNDSGCYSWEKQVRYASGGRHWNKEQGRRNNWNRNGYAGKSIGQWKPKSYIK